MKNNIKLIIGVLIGALASGIIVYAATGITTRNIGYGNVTAKEALDDLYKKVDKQNIEVKKVCKLESEEFGNKGAVGAKYKCQLGANDKDENGVIHRYFYILAVNNDNTVDLIMDRNIIEGVLDWNNAYNYFDNIDNGISIKNSWTNVLKISLPSAQDIANAVDNSSWKVQANTNWWCLETKTKDSSSSCNNSTVRTMWLWDYLQGCDRYNCVHSLGSNWAKGYWTNDTLRHDGSSGWSIEQQGRLNNGPSDSGGSGIRPVITLLKSNLYE